MKKHLLAQNYSEPATYLFIKACFTARDNFWILFKIEINMKTVTKFVKIIIASKNITL